MYTKLLATALLAALTMPCAQGAESEFQITPRGGFGDLKINADRLSDGQALHDDTAGIGCGFGILTPIGLVIEGGVEAYGNEDLFDDDAYYLAQRFISVGYQFELGDGWRIVPKVGRTKWTLDSEDRNLLQADSSSPPQDRVRGYEYFWEASVSKRISRVVALGVTYKAADYDFGHAHSASFVATFGF